jgi:hypothetical protein
MEPEMFQAPQIQAGTDQSRATDDTDDAENRPSSWRTGSQHQVQYEMNLYFAID